MKIFDGIVKRLARRINEREHDDRIKRVRHFYSAIQAAATGRTESQWTTWPISPDNVVNKYLRTLIARSRHAVANNDHAKKFTQMVRDNVVGPNGFTLHAQVQRSNSRIDEPANNAIEAAYRRQSRRESWDIAGKLSRTEFERLWIQTIATDGEAIAIIHQGDYAGPTGFSLQMIDPLFIDPQHNQILSQDRYIRHGIEFDHYGRTHAYYFRKYDEVHPQHVTYESQKYERVPAERVIHAFVPEMVGQKRGLPWMQTALWRMRMLQAYEDAAVTAARTKASDMLLFKDEEGVIDNEQLEAFELDVEAGIGRVLPAGLTPHNFHPTYPSGEFDVFTKSVLRSIASGLGVSYNNLSSDLTSVNFSSIRQGALEERQMWRGLQEWVIDTFCRPIYERWLERALLTGEIKIDSGAPLNPSRINKYKKVHFIGRRWQWIDPSSEIAAHEKAIALKLASRQGIIRESGADPYDIWQQIAEEEKAMKEQGIDPTVYQPGAAKNNNSNTKEKETK